MSEEMLKDQPEVAANEEITEDVVLNGVHNYSGEDSYVWPEDPAVREKIEWFRDQKFALMMHWGAYCQIGIVESWALSDGDGNWSRDQIDWTDDMDEFKQQYFDLNKTFNPIRFKPDDWAKAAKDAGFKYFIFTTKHHDGFCMWDTKYTDYKVTAEDCPFHTHRYADICKYLFDSMRKEGVAVTAYFSKADWHCPDYWQTRDNTWRGPSYKFSENDPEAWERFVQFTQNQLRELADEYGPIETLWFDAGWVREKFHQDIRLGELIDELRTRHPGLLSVDRTVGGAYENYVTPEQCVPDQPLNIPWESCITMGNSFSFNYEDDYKSPRQIIAMLTDIVAKGGNLALNVGPQPDGRLPKGALKTMKGIGEWLRKYGEAIYGTRVCAPYKKDDVCFTQKEKENLVYAIKYYKDENPEVEATVWVPYTGEITKVVDLYNGEEVQVEKRENGYYFTSKEVEENAIARVFQIHTA